MSPSYNRHLGTYTLQDLIDGAFPAWQAYSIAFHPSGFHLIIGQSDKLRLMNLLMEAPHGSMGALHGLRDRRWAGLSGSHDERHQGLTPGVMQTNTETHKIP